MDTIYKYGLSKAGYKAFIGKASWETVIVHIMKNQRTYCGIRAPYEFDIDSQGDYVWCDICLAGQID